MTVLVVSAALSAAVTVVTGLSVVVSVEVTAPIAAFVLPAAAAPHLVVSVVHLLARMIAVSATMIDAIATGLGALTVTVR